MTKNRHNQFIETVNECINNGVSRGVLHLNIDTSYQMGKHLPLSGRKLINFASYSYLGLEQHEKLINATVEAVRQFGTQFGISRAYSSLNLYEKLENNLSLIFNCPAIVAPTTTLAHQSVIPVLIENSDAIILDHQVHASVHSTVKMLQNRGVYTEMIRHNDLDMLEDRIKLMRQKFQKIWYLCDGVYSMYGDFAPIPELYSLLEKYEQLNLYIDDAHGMSWTGKNGSGYIRSQVELEERVILISSLNKAFAANGGVILIKNKGYYRKVRNCGGPLIFSCPVPPPMLGAGIASSEIHLSEEIYSLQRSLAEKIKYCNELLIKHGLPVIAHNNSPLFYVGMGLPKVGYNIIKRLMNNGFYTSIGLFPAVPIKCSGIRFCINNLQSKEDIKNLVEAIRHHFPLALKEENSTEEEINKAFKKTLITKKLIPDKIINAQQLLVHHFRSIRHIDKDLWNNLLGDNGTFDWQGLLFLENSFKHNQKPESNWDFHYFIIYDSEKKPVLATFFTITLCKDDLFSPKDVSQKVEIKREKHPYYLCSKTLIMGSMLTVGNHLYINYDCKNWKNAFKLLLKKVAFLQDTEGITTTVLRDFPTDNEETSDFLLSEGYFKINLPDTHIVEKPTWKNLDDFYAGISRKARKSAKKFIFKHQNDFIIDIKQKGSLQEIEQWYNLYLNVKSNSFEINTFGLPRKVFKRMSLHKNWEIIEIKLKSGTPDKEKCIAVIFCYKTSNTYSPMIIGLDYEYLESHHIYKQSLFQVAKRARDINADIVYLGPTASLEKRRIGAKPIRLSAFVQTNDNFNMKLLDMIQYSKTWENNLNKSNNTIKEKLGDLPENGV